MPEEIELKLALGLNGALSLRRHPLLANQPSHQEILTNTYFDTPDGALAAARIALRIRQTPTRILQTLKTAGHSSGGLSSRGEWEWAIPDASLDVAGLSRLAPIQALGAETLHHLEPRFVTDFERHSWILQYADATIEVALDQGEIRAGKRCVVIDELELELKSGSSTAGDPMALWQLATRFSEQISLRPANISKAARGEALCEADWSLPQANDTFAARFDHAIACLDALTDSGDERFREQARLTLDALADAAARYAGVSEPARGMAVALATPDWLTPRFGQRSLALRLALQSL